MKASISFPCVGLTSSSRARYSHHPILHMEKSRLRKGNSLLAMMQLGAEGPGLGPRGVSLHGHASYVPLLPRGRSGCPLNPTASQPALSHGGVTMRLRMRSEGSSLRLRVGGWPTALLHSLMSCQRLAALVLRLGGVTRGHGSSGGCGLHSWREGQPQGRGGGGISGLEA